MKIKDLALLFCLWVLCLLVLLPNLQIWPPDRDQGVFLYFGRRILDGEIPYRDLWDHKGPMIYYINALGLLLSGGSAWGVWLLEAVSLGSAVFIGFLLMYRAFGTVPAFWGSVLWLISLTRVLQWGNFTEEFALPLQFLALYLTYQSRVTGCSVQRSFLFGLTGAAAFLLRPNLIGVHLGCVLYLLFQKGFLRQRRELVTVLAAMSLGSLSLIFAFLLYFVSKHAFAAFWDCMFTYNFTYVGLENHGSLLSVLLMGMRRLNVLSTVSVFAYIVALFHLWRARGSTSHQMTLVSLVVLAAPIVAHFSIISHRVYRHYYITLLPTMGILAGYYAWVSMNALARLRARWTSVRARFVLGFLWLGMSLVAPLPFLGDQLMRSYGNASELRAEKIDYRWAIDYIRRHTDESDYVLLWGAEASTNFAAGRRSPTRFVYQYPLYTPGYQNDALIARFLMDIREKKPKMIIDASSTEASIPPLNDRIATWTHRWYRSLPKMREVYEHIANNYHFTDEIGDLGWRVYEHNADERGNCCSTHSREPPAAAR